MSLIKSKMKQTCTVYLMSLAQSKMKQIMGQWSNHLQSNVTRYNQ